MAKAKANAADKVDWKIVRDAKRKRETDVNSMYKEAIRDVLGTIPKEGAYAAAKAGQSGSWIVRQIGQCLVQDNERWLPMLYRLVGDVAGLDPTDEQKREAYQQVREAMVETLNDALVEWAAECAKVSQAKRQGVSVDTVPQLWRTWQPNAQAYLEAAGWTGNRSGFGDLSAVMDMLGD